MLRRGCGGDERDMVLLECCWVCREWAMLELSDGLWCDDEVVLVFRDLLVSW